MVKVLSIESAPRKIETNPLKFDPGLRKMVDKVERVEKFTTFERWKDSFLAKYEKYLEQDGCNRAAKAYDDFQTCMEQCMKILWQVQEHVRNEEFGDGQTVKATAALKELVDRLSTKVIKEMEGLIPQTSVEEKLRHYDKYQLGAVLIRDGFEEYDRMKFLSETLEEIGPELPQGDKQQSQVFTSYNEQLQTFCDVMADLGLYEVMVKSREFAFEPSDTESEDEEEESDDEPDPDPIIFVDLKTASVFSVEREEVESHGTILTMRDDGEYLQAAKMNSEEYETIKTQLTEHTRLGIATQVIVKKEEVEELGLAEADKVSAIWGVALKKREKNKKGEEFLFIDPKTNQAGELKRSKCINDGFITTTRSDTAEDLLEQAIVDELEYDRVIATIRRVFGIKAVR